jgi:hypothetical protein
MTKRMNTSLPILLIIVLAALAVPRAVLHDLHAIPLDSPIYTVLAIVPFAIWALFALLGKSKRPIYDFLVLGIIFGLMLAITHQLTWDASWGGNLPHLHGNLEGKLNPVVESLLLRTAAFISSLLTGVVFGGIVALIAWMTFKTRKQITQKK